MSRRVGRVAAGGVRPAAPPAEHPTPSPRPAGPHGPRRGVGRRGDPGQAAIELLGVLPLACAVALGLTQALLAGYAGLLAGHAAEAAAISVQHGGDAGDARAAARAALPGWGERRVRVELRGRRVTVHLRPPSVIAPLARALEAGRTADAGPTP